MKNKIIVTGGLGFLGQHLVYGLTERYPKSEIVILARSERSFFLSDFGRNNNIKIVYGTDITEPDSIEEYFKDADTVFHTAAMISFWRKDKKKLFYQNVAGTENIVDLCKKYKKRLIYISSTAALGYNNDKNNPADEKFQFNWKKADKFAYMLSKYHAEEKVKQGIEESLSAIIVNISTIFGPGDERIFALIDNLLKNKVPFILPGGFAAIDVRDGVSGILALHEKGKTGNSYLLTGGNYTYKEFLETVSGLLGVAPPSKIIAGWIGRILIPLIYLMEALVNKSPALTAEIFAPGLKYRYYSAKKTNSDTGWQPEYNLEKTFRDVIKYYHTSLGK